MNQEWSTKMQTKALRLDSVKLDTQVNLHPIGFFEREN
jgi:hypothetical protein